MGYTDSNILPSVYCNSIPHHRWLRFALCECYTILSPKRDEAKVPNTYTPFIFHLPTDKKKLRR